MRNCVIVSLILDHKIWQSIVCVKNGHETEYVFEFFPRQLITFFSGVVMCAFVDVNDVTVEFDKNLENGYRTSAADDKPSRQ